MLYVFRWTDAEGDTVSLADWLWTDVFAAAIGPPKLASVAFALAVVGVCYGFALVLWRRRVFVKL